MFKVSKISWSDLCGGGSSPYVPVSKYELSVTQDLFQKYDLNYPIRSGRKMPKSPGFYGLCI